MKCLVFIVVAIVLNAFPQHSGQSIGVSGAEVPKSTFRFANINDYDEMDDGSINETPEFVFHPDDFDYIPVLGLPKVPNRGPDYIGNAGDTGSGDTLVGENASEAAVTTEITAQRPSSCDYDAEEKLREVKISRRGRRRVSDIQCEQNMWNYKYKVLEYQRNVNHCMTWNRLYGNHSGIPGGIEVTQGDFPHMGAVGWRLKDRADDGSIFVFLCGSSLISTRYSLTAAHCTSVRSYLKDDKNLEQSRPEIVRFGSVYIGSDNVKNHDTVGTKDVTIDDLIKLEEYRFRYKYNDIALIRLKEEVDISLNIRPACLYTEDVYTTGVGAVNVTGWGSTQTDSHSDILLFAELDLIDQNKCEEQLGNNIKDWRGLQNHQFCAGKAEGGVDTCDGDSGGPLQIQKPLPSALQDAGLTYYVLGITSFGVKCARPNKPGVYTKVSDHNFLCWIERTVWPEETNYDCTGDRFRGYQLPPKI